MPYLLGEEEGRPHNTLWWRMGEEAAFRSGDGKLVRDRSAGPGLGWQLFNLADDLGATRDRRGEHPELLERLAESWNLMDAETKVGGSSPSE
ncbi:hypothetical protein [Tautonia sociabilis]|uniref:Uncharacterized protein n=1 Tax=Tautonia sociabilis TaxID=2080755 RepID=A0A432MPG5_9BACT|nr:hypothetical protein [Tautonia sociabilis]RUL89353.1 hypothetical protein TsocGM_02780 [Tautonia sociabilis]